MAGKLKLMCILAHPDDESLGAGGILAKYAAEGVETYWVTATRGESGWFGEPSDYPGPEAQGHIRERELKAAAKVLRLQEVSFLDYRDGELADADQAVVVGELVEHIRRVKPDVVVTFDPNGSYGHLDHIAVCQLATAAVVAAADADHDGAIERRSHRVSKLYYMVETTENIAAFEKVFGELVMNVIGEDRRTVAWQPWAITTRVDASAHWPTVLEAILNHRSQLPGYEILKSQPDEDQEFLWGHPAFYRAISLVNVGQEVENDLFDGIRSPAAVGR
ncbi:MAG: PIG-L family deacetylase [SAR202 cluster bacterium]|jgi:LmbE family N-acetylglucosaminyl deacetylase|nr:PIG-L family deacetylase [SAR202 cluster bacterium]MDP7103330.1 PIG-L family deacetylase [SAR202 cluster bacterium]MDP7224753.1 PIG-L family deacetylase [SAR202 cluster bacterium]MDP7412774.1 PIG-L family deacetylase [SAR202 cluster bacterium]|tara:strand:- start:701 stop:1531 length:831 start_codon:yes stop_codon:yes gene_type:complete